MGTQHLVVLVHGLNGSRKDFIRWSDPFSEIVDDKAFLVFEIYENTNVQFNNGYSIYLK